jgi:hypothetical protein
MLFGVTAADGLEILEIRVAQRNIPVATGKIQLGGRKTDPSAE